MASDHDKVRHDGAGRSGVNVVGISGTLSRPAAERTLPSGDRLVSLEVTVARAGERAETVPVAWFNAPGWGAALDAGDEVLLVGRVRRRFFRAGAETASRTEVVAEAVARGRDTKRAEAVLRRVARRLGELGTAAGEW